MQIPELQPPAQGSKGVHRMGYDGASTFSVQFQPDKVIYRYTAVPAEVAQAVIDHDSASAGVRKFLRDGGFEFYKIDPKDLDGPEGVGS